MYNIKAPVVIFCYSRKEKLQRLIESLMNCNHASDYDVFFFCDASSYKRPEDIEKVFAVRKYVENIKKENFFRSVTLSFAEKHMGCRKSVIKGVSKIISRYGRVIDLEDDLIVSRDFLDYMEEGLKRFEDDRAVWSISGLTFPLKSLDQIKTDFYLNGRGNSCGFATWKNRWDLIDWNVTDYDSFRSNSMLQDRFSERGYDLPYLLKQQKEGSLDSWAIEWDYCQFKFGMKTVYPVKSRVYHCGEDGTHVSDDIPQQAICLTEVDYSYESICESKKIDGEYRELFWSSDDYEKYKSKGSDNNKWYEYYRALNKWMLLKEKGISICQYFKINKINKIAIYGAGELGKHLLWEARKEEIEVACFIDKKCKNPIDGIDVIGIDEAIPKCDAIVVTPIVEFYDISKKLIERTIVPLISLAELV